MGERGDERDGDEHHEKDGVGAGPGVLGYLDGGADDDGHHDDGVGGAHEGGDLDLEVGGGDVAEDEVEEGGHDGEQEGLPEAGAQSGVVGARDHEEDGGGPQHCGDHEEELVDDVEVADAVVDLEISVELFIFYRLSFICTLCVN